MYIQESVQTDHDDLLHLTKIKYVKTYVTTVHYSEKWHTVRKEKNNYPDMKQLEVSACILV